MPMTIYKLYASAATDDAASLDVQLDGVIQSIHMSGAWLGCDALNDGGAAELSFLSTNTWAANDSRGSLMIIQTLFGLLTQGGFQAAVNAQISSLEIPVNAGERIHLHVQDQGSPTSRVIYAFLFVADKGIARQAGRRR